MRRDRQATSRNDDVVLGLVVVLGIVAAGIVAAALLEVAVPESMSTLAVGIVGGVLGYVTAGRTPAQTSDTDPLADPVDSMPSDPVPDDAEAGFHDDYLADDYDLADAGETPRA